MTRAGTIILVDGMAGAGGSTFLSGMPKPLNCLDTDIEGWRWLRGECAVYEATRNMVRIREVLDKWSRQPLEQVASIAYDDCAFAWQLVCQHVMDDAERSREYNTKNAFRAWGPAKMSIRRIHDALIRAKLAGKHVGLRCHSKRDLKQIDSGGKQEIVDLGEKWDCEQFIDKHLDAAFRMKYDKNTHKRWLEVVKCRACYNEEISQEEWERVAPDMPKLLRPCFRKPVFDLGERIEVPDYQSHLMHARIIRRFEEVGALVESNGVEVNADAEDASALFAMESAAKGGRR